MAFMSPQLPVSEILAAFKEYDIIMSENDFRSPDPLRWREIYSLMFEALSGISIETAIQTILKEIKMNSTSPEAFEEAAGQIAFTQCLQRVMSGCGYKDFSLKDVLSPSPKGVRRISSVFVNRSRHDTLLINFIEETAEKAQKSLGEYESLLRRNKELKQRQNEDLTNYEHRRVELKKIQGDIDDTNKVFAELESALEEEKQCGQELKLKISEAKSDKATLKPLLEQKHQECEDLSRKIVQSPEKFEVDLERLKNKVTEMRAQLSRKEQNVSDGRILSEHSKQEADAAAKAFKMAVDVQADLDKEKENLTKIGELTDKQTDLQESIKSCHTQEEDLQERYNIRQAQRRSLASNTDLRQQSGLQQMEGYRQYADKLRDNLKAARSKTSLINDNIAQVNSEIAEWEDRIAAQRKTLEKESISMTQVIDKLDDMSTQSLLNLKMCLGEG